MWPWYKVTFFVHLGTQTYNKIMELLCEWVSCQVLNQINVVVYWPPVVNMNTTRIQSYKGPCLTVLREASLLNLADVAAEQRLPRLTRSEDPRHANVTLHRWAGGSISAQYCRTAQNGSLNVKHPLVPMAKYISPLYGNEMMFTCRRDFNAQWVHIWQKNTKGWAELSA